MQIISLFTQNLLSPAILFFALGIFAGLTKSNLTIPKAISEYLAIYLIIAIGFKGGVALSETPEINQEVILAILCGAVIGFLQPFLGYYLLKKTTKLDNKTMAAISAHYGSISMVTLVTAMNFLNSNSIVYAGYIVAILTIMEAPAIFSGLFIANKNSEDHGDKKHYSEIVKEILSNASVLLLVGAFVIGTLTGSKGMKEMEGFLTIPFKGMLALFLLDMGLVVAKQKEHMKEFSTSLVLFAIYMPLIGYFIGLFTSYFIGLDLGTGMLFSLLCASASYIAVPAAMRIALPEAKISIYLPMSLGITFPFNIVFGIPLYYAGAKFLLT